jgi:hypothetical protein
MPILQLAKVIDAAKELAKGAASADLGFGVEVTLPNGAAGGGEMVINYNREKAFSMKSVQPKGETLTLDRSHTHRNGDKGWGTLGLLLSLRYGLARGCKRVRIATEVQGTAKEGETSETANRKARSYWGKIPFSDKGADLKAAIVDTMLKINDTSRTSGNVPRTPPTRQEALLSGSNRGTGGSTREIEIVTVAQTINLKDEDLVDKKS